MQSFNLKKGLDLPVAGAPEQKIHPGAQIRSVAVIGPDYVALKPRMMVQEGDDVVRGQPLFCHKDAPEAMMVTPMTGRVAVINRGDRRVL